MKQLLKDSGAVDGAGKGAGGNGGGILVIIADEIINEGYICSNGSPGEDALTHSLARVTKSFASGGGGGSGGSIYIKVHVLKNYGYIECLGGVGGDHGTHIQSRGGNGAVGRIRIECPNIETLGTVTSKPTQFSIQTPVELFNGTKIQIE